MAIAFARFETVSRSKGANACLKAAYNERTKLKCERTGQTFFFGHREGNKYHEILLPDGADLRFKQAALLWNTAENAEKRSDSQVAYDMVIALPDDKQITLDDKIELVQRFLKENFVDKGLAVQLDIHAPHENERNWHAHALITTRRFTKDGQALGEKARDLNPTFCKGHIVEGDIWGEKWRFTQNAYFQEKGYDLVVDDNGLVPQDHLGPLRMRQFMADTEIGFRSDLIQQANEDLVRDPEAILEFLTKHNSTFKEADLDRFLQKHIEAPERQFVKKAVFESPSLLQLWEKDNTHPLGASEEKDLFTTREVRAEEKRIERLAEKINTRNGIDVSTKTAKTVLVKHTLTEDQRQVFLAATGSLPDSEDNGLVIIQGRAGTGKSYTLQSIKEAYEQDGIKVMGLAPTHTVAQDLAQEAGFSKARTIHKMLFDHKNKRDLLPKNSVLIVDEAGMIPNDAFHELLAVAKTTKSKVILVGDERQLASISRNGMFPYLAEKHGSVELYDIKRQSLEWQKEVSQYLSQGQTKEALEILQDQKRIHWKEHRSEAAHELVKTWIKAHHQNPQDQKLIIARTNVMVESFNKSIRHHLKQTGLLSKTEYDCMTLRSDQWLRIRVSIGDRIQFTQTKKKLGISNGILGTLQDVREIGKGKNQFEFVVKQDNGKEVTFNPSTFHGFTLGYASTIYKAQGKTKPSVFIYHDGTSSKALAYVSLTRQKNDLHLFVSKETTKDFKDLVLQMSHEEKKIASLRFSTLADMEEKRAQIMKRDYLMNEQNKLNPFSFFFKHTLKNKLQDVSQEIKTKIKDHLHQKNSSFYNLPPTQRDQHHTVIQLDRVRSEQKQTTLNCDSESLKNKKDLEDIQNVKKYTDEIEKQEQRLRQHQEHLERQKQLKFDKML
ncbi:MAG: AAA family ATPase [Alphaproteobacteria bacterium]|nr:AAA family ATPase [Alphaproteobacteria bacterium]